MKGIMPSALYPKSAIPIVFCLFLFPTAWYGLAQEWLLAEQDNSHAFPAFLAALFITLTTHYVFADNLTRSRIFSKIVTAAVVCLYVIAVVINIQIIAYVLMIAGLGLLMFSFFGTVKWVSSLQIISLITLSLPIWDALLEPLVNLASHVVTYIVNLFNITVLIEGNSITTPYGRILIAEGCSGIRYFMVSVVFSILISHFNQYRIGGTLAAMAIGCLVGLMANWLRITLLVFIGYYSEMRSNLMTDHETFGWVIFAVFILPALYFAPHSKATTVTYEQKGPLTNRKAFLHLITLGLISHTLLIWLNLTYVQGTINNEPTVMVGEEIETPAFAKSLPNSDQESLKWQERNNVFIGHRYNSKASLTDKLVPYVNQSFVNNLWFLERNHIGLGSSGISYPILKSFLTDKRVVRLQMFQVGQFWTSSYTQAKLLQIPALFSGNNHFQYFLFLAECSSQSCTNELENIESITKELMSQ